VRRTFALPGRVRSARAYVTGLGLYELEINGRLVGQERLTPYCTGYDYWVQSQVFDVTDLLLAGDNAVGAMLSNGWAKGPFGTFGALNTPYVDVFALLCELRVVLEDGREVVVASGPDWRCAPSPIVADCIYDGEVYDANREIPGWSTAGFDDAAWDAMKEWTPVGIGPVVDRLSPPVLVKETLAPAALLQTPAGEWVLDMGQNMVGWLRIRVREPKGATIRISHGEILQDGNFYRDNLRGAKAEYVYTSDGTERTVEPHTTFYGFRFAKLEGFSGPIDPADFTGCVVYSDLETTGSIETSDPLVDRLFRNAMWSQKGNFLDVPTDCPQRDERMGWTGDAQIFSGTASFNMDTYAFYTKFLHDVWLDQKACGGKVASTIPTFSKDKDDGSGFLKGGACAWSDAATVIPWEVYLHFGDPTILERQYESMKAWVDWIRGRDAAAGDCGLWLEGFQFGDWLALDGPVEGGVFGGTDNGLLASAYYRLSSNLVAKAAHVLGKTEDAALYGALTERIRRAIQDEFFSKNGRAAVGTQTAHVVALHFDLVPEAVRARVLADLRVLLRRSCGHLKTGFIGTPILCRALADNGDPDTAFRLFFQEDYPSWLYEVVMGATTIWERWNSVLPDGRISGTGMNSLNHYAYGSIVEWMYRNLCGIQPQEDAPGFQRFTVKPDVYGKLWYAKARVRSAKGWVESGWERRPDGTLAVRVVVPFDAEATAYLPDADRATVRGLGALAAAQEGSRAKVVLSAGTYEFTYAPTRDYTLHYSIRTQVADLFADPDAKAVLTEVLPRMIAYQNDGGVHESSESLEALFTGPEAFLIRMRFGEVNLAALDAKLRAVPVKVRTK
jgi:alpha-L-rhamnosidase